jgi:hypothetical protein
MAQVSVGLSFIPRPRRGRGTGARRGGTPSRIADFLSVEQAIWSRTRLSHEQLASSLSDPLERDVGFLAYQDEKPVGFARLTTSPDSAFAGLWGGGVLENFRGT